jgi:hypothetical protein
VRARGAPAVGVLVGVDAFGPVGFGDGERGEAAAGLVLALAGCFEEVVLDDRLVVVADEVAERAFGEVRIRAQRGPGVGQGGPLWT